MNYRGKRRACVIAFVAVIAVPTLFADAAASAQTPDKASNGVYIALSSTTQTGLITPSFLLGQVDYARDLGNSRLCRLGFGLRFSNSSRGYSLSTSLMADYLFRLGGGRSGHMSVWVRVSDMPRGICPRLLHPHLMPSAPIVPSVWKFP